MIAQLVGAFAIIILAVALAPIVLQQVNSVQSEANMTSFGGGTLSTMTTIFPFLLGAMVLMIVIPMIISALRSGGLMGGSGGVEGGDDDYDDEESEEDDEESDDEDEEDSDDEVVEDDEEPKQLRSSKHSTTITTIKRTGEKKINVKVGPGYNVDKYALDTPADNKLTLKEADLNKTKFD